MYFLRYLCFQRHCMIHPNACTSTLSGILIPIINNQKYWDQHKILTHRSPNPTFCSETWNYGREGEEGGFSESPLRAGPPFVGYWKCILPIEAAAWK